MSNSAQWPEAVPHLLDKQGRLFERREVAATLQLVPVEEIGKHALSPAARCAIDLAREDAAADRQLDDAGVVLWAQRALLEIQPRRGSGRVGQPVQTDLIQHL